MSLLFWDVTEHEITTILEKLNPAGFEIEADGTGFIAGYCVNGNDFNWLQDNYKTWEEAGKKLIAEIIGVERSMLSDALQYSIENMDGNHIFEVGENEEDEIFASLDGELIFKNGKENAFYEEEYEAYLEIYLKLRSLQV